MEVTVSPLASGYLCGYHGEFLFDKINMEYPPVVPYVAMRSLSAAAGIALVPCVFHVRRGWCNGHCRPWAHAAPLSLADHEGARVLLCHQLSGSIFCSIW